MAASVSAPGPGSLPIPRTRLIGREAEIAAARGFLLDETVPLLTLTGPGGVGKTRLALTVAHDVASQFADGEVWVDLAPLADPALVPATVASAVGLVPAAGKPLAGELARALHSRQLLLLLDNCEHVLATTVDLAAQLLASCPALQILATSRAPLRVRGEQVLPVEPFPVPADAEVARERVEHNDAVRLFVTRARAVHPRFALTAANAPSVAALCRQLDGLPLAIELAAARSAILSPQALLVQMANRPGLLTGGARDLPVRQQTIRATIAWSYDLLDARAQAMFRRLAVFSGGFTLAAAEAISYQLSAISSTDEAIASTARQHDCSTPSVLDLLESLVEQSLVHQESGTTDGPRFAMLETIREFALEQLTAHGGAEQARAAHARWVYDLVQRAGPDLAFGRASTGWYATLDRERDNVRSALEWWLRQGMAQPLLETAGTLADYWWLRSAFNEGQSWSERALALEHAEVPPDARLGALYGASAFASLRGDYPRAMAAGQEMLEGARAGQDVVDVARAYFVLCVAARYQGDREATRGFARLAIESAQEADSPNWVGWTLINVCEVSDDAEAEAAGKQALAIFREFGSEFGQENVLRKLAAAAARRGADIEAARRYLESLALTLLLDIRWSTIDIIIGTAAVATYRGWHEAAGILLAAGTAWASIIGYGHVDHPASLARLTHERLRRTLDTAAFARATECGAALPADEAVALMRRVLEAIVTGGPMPTLATSPVIALSMSTDGFSLTRREREILDLLGQHLTDAEIAQRLFLSPRTASNHVSRILAKLGVANRREAVAHAARHALLERPYPSSSEN